jgi:hypothetical protein
MWDDLDIDLRNGGNSHFMNLLCRVELDSTLNSKRYELRKYQILCTEVLLLTKVLENVESNNKPMIQDYKKETWLLHPKP